MRARPPARGAVQLLGLSLGALVLLGTTGCRVRTPRARAAAALRATRHEPASRVAEGDAARRAGDSERAIATYEATVRANPSYVPAHLRLVSTLSAVGRRSRARELYAARAVAPGATDADRTMAARLSGDGSDDALRRVYGEAARRSPDNPWWRLAQAEVELASAGAALAAAEESDRSGDRPRGEASRRRARGALEAAEVALDHAERLGPAIPETALYRGLSFSLAAELDRAADARTEKHSLAAAWYSKAAVLEPKMVEAWAALADAKAREGVPGEALLAYLEAVRLAPSDPALREGAAHVLRSLDRHLDAADQLRAAAVLRPRSAAPLLDVGDSLAAACRPDGALEAYAEALRRDPKAVEAHRRRAQVLEREGRVAEARAAYQAYLDGGGEDAAEVGRRLERLAERAR